MGYFLIDDVGGGGGSVDTSRFATKEEIENINDEIENINTKIEKPMTIEVLDSDPINPSIGQMWMVSGGDA